VRYSGPGYSTLSNQIYCTHEISNVIVIGSRRPMLDRDTGIRVYSICYATAAGLDGNRRYTVDRSFRIGNYDHSTLRHQEKNGSHIYSYNSKGR
jgi:hypothetical protein